MDAPKIDKRTIDEIIAQTVALAEKYTGDASSTAASPEGRLSELQAAHPAHLKGWQAPPDDDPDAGMALICIFGRYMELLVDRLNQVPEKNYLAFLNLIGADILPPQPARVPLTFGLAEGYPADAVVPAGTQVAALPEEDEEEEVVFETERDIVVTRARLEAVLTQEPEADRYGEYTERALGTDDQAFPAFVGDPLIEHTLYVACDELLALARPKTVTLTFTSPDASALAGMAVTWSYWDGAVWQELAAKSSRGSSEEWQVTIHDCPALAPRTIDDREACWLRGRSAPPLPGDRPTISKATVKVEISQGDITPELAFANAVPLDLTTDFYPFGEQPRLTDALYLACNEVFGKAGARVTIDLKLSDPLPGPVEPSDDLEITWEAWNGITWEPCASDPANSKVVFSDGGTVAFTLPEHLAPREVNDESNFWVRARITKGGYGAEADYRRVEHTVQVPEAPESLVGLVLADELTIDDTTWPADTCISSQLATAIVGSGIADVKVRMPTYGFTPATFAPPSLQSLRLSYTYDRSAAALHCLCCNDFVYEDHSADAAGGNPFEPFRPSADIEPALYLGFDAPLGNRPVSLYLQVQEPEPDEVTPGKASEWAAGDGPEVIWEYSRADGEWERLRAIDETQALTRRGLVRFIGPPDLASRVRFGRTLYWLRARLASGEHAIAPRLRRVLLNTTWAAQATTMADETLGSSNGDPGQAFELAQAPVLPGARIEVREPGMPSDDERARIEAEEGADAITHVLDEAGHPAEAWVRWHAVADFYGSGPQDRHYTIDCLSGTVRFGDGRSGLIPPQGPSNIRAARYQTGGGAAGNRAPGTVTELKSSLPYIDSVTNHEAAAGGAEQQSLDRVKRYGPRRLRHRGRAVTAEDLEDLAFAASPDVARAKALSVFRDGRDTGQVGLTIVPRGGRRQPVPDVGLLERVTDYLEARCPADAPPLRVTGPDWIEVTVTAQVVPTSPEAADAVRVRLLEALERFLHPLTGGALGKGWPFGRWPHESELYALIEDVDGVDHVSSLVVQMDPPAGEIREDSLIHSGPHRVTVVSG